MHTDFDVRIDLGVLRPPPPNPFPASCPICFLQVCQNTHSPVREELAQSRTWRRRETSYRHGGQHHGPKVRDKGALCGERLARSPSDLRASIARVAICTNSRTCASRKRLGRSSCGTKAAAFSVRRGVRRRSGNRATTLRRHRLYTYTCDRQRIGQALQRASGDVATKRSSGADSSSSAPLTNGKIGWAPAEKHGAPYTASPKN
eukprot:6188487-Pleurochrysis_carterae.AAC.1